MKICAIISEFNPLHNGHKFFLDEARKISGCDALMAVCSGNFVQRALPAVCDKFARANQAVSSGVDVVVQLPTAFAVNSAEVFATAGIKIACSFKNVTALCFGSECGDINLLNEVADFLIEEPKEFKDLMKKFLKDGNSFSASRKLALQKMIEQKKLDSKFLEVIEKPNNILGVEYIKAVKQLKSNIAIYTIKRVGRDYDDKTLDEKCSSSAVREELYKNNAVKNIKQCVPNKVYLSLQDELKNYKLPDLKLFNQLLFYKLKTDDVRELKNIFDVKEGLENRIIECAKNAKDWQEFVQLCVAKRYAEKLIRRIGINSLLNIDKSLIENLYKCKALPFVKVLAVKKSGVINSLQSASNVIVRNSDVKGIKDAFSQAVIEVEQMADNIYAILSERCFKVPYMLQPSVICSF